MLLQNKDIYFWIGPYFRVTNFLRSISSFSVCQQRKRQTCKADIIALKASFQFELATWPPSNWCNLKRATKVNKQIGGGLSSSAAVSAATIGEESWMKHDKLDKKIR
jgi:hypothetical protein